MSHWEGGVSGAGEGDWRKGEKGEGTGMGETDIPADNYIQEDELDEAKPAALVDFVHDDFSLFPPSSLLSLRSLPFLYHPVPSLIHIPLLDSRCLVVSRTHRAQLSPFAGSGLRQQGMLFAWSAASRCMQRHI